MSNLLLGSMIYVDGNLAEIPQAEFNKFAGMQLPVSFFQRILGGEDYATFVRRIVCELHNNPLPDVIREKLFEIGLRT